MVLYWRNDDVVQTTMVLCWRNDGFHDKMMGFMIKRWPSSASGSHWPSAVGSVPLLGGGSWCSRGACCMAYFLHTQVLIALFFHTVLLCFFGLKWCIGAATERYAPRLTLMVGWWDTDVTVEPSPDVAFPHAAMVTPPAAVRVLVFRYNTMMVSC